MTRRAFLRALLGFGGLAIATRLVAHNVDSLEKVVAGARPDIPFAPMEQPAAVSRGSLPLTSTPAPLTPTPLSVVLGPRTEGSRVEQVAGESSTDWAQAAGNPQRTAFMPAETLGSSWSVAWRYQFHVQAREKLFPQVQAIVSAGHVLVPTLMGKLRSFAAGQTGPAVNWTADVGAPIMGSAAADGVRAYVADVYGRLSAYTLVNGQLAWGPIQVTDGLPIQSSLLLADGKLMVGGADGVFYARDPATGAAIWSRPVGAPILQTAAWSSVAGVGLAVVGAADMRVYAIDSTTGSIAWQTAPLFGAAFKDYWPVIDETRGMVAVRPWAKLPYWERGNPPGLNVPIRAIEVSDYLNDSDQSAALAAYDANPTQYAKSLYIFDLASGTELPPPVHWYFAVNMHGSPPPPCLDRDGYMVIPTYRPSSFSATSWRAGWARVNLTNRKVVDGLLDASNPSRGGGNRDENMAVSACSNGIIAMHCQEGNAQYSGFYEQSNRRWYPANGGAGTNLLFVNAQGPSANPAAISRGMVYHLAHPHTLVCFKVV